MLTSAPERASTDGAGDRDLTRPGRIGRRDPPLSEGTGPQRAPGLTPVAGAGAESLAPEGISVGQVFADILLLAALSCQTAFAVVSVPQAAGQWSTLSYGFEQRVGLNDPRLFELIAGRTGPVEVADLPLTSGLAGSPLAVAPHEIRWAYGAALRGPSGAVLGVVAVLDRNHRELSRRERRAMLAVVRQMARHLSELRKVASTAPGASVESPPVAPAARISGPPILTVKRGSDAMAEGPQLLRSHEVAVLFDVTERTVINWAAAGKLPSLRTVGGHLRFHSEDVLGLLAGRSLPAG